MILPRPYMELLTNTSRMINGQNVEQVRGYDSLGRLNSFSTDLAGQNIHSTTQSYDKASRLKTITAGDHNFTYAYQRNQVSSLTFKKGTSTVLTTAKTYDKLYRLKTINETAAVMNKTTTYTLNDANQRINVVTPTHSWDYQYDALGQVTSAVKKDANGIVISTQNYNFDDIGNRKTADGATYTSNDLNQITSLTGAPSLTYDQDGNLLSDGLWTYTYNAENRLIKMVSGTKTLDFLYDYQGRRVSKRITDSSVVTSHTIFLYDGWNLIAELDALAQNTTVKRTYTWGTDLSGTSQGAGGVGGLLSMSDQDSSNHTVYYYTYDANGNVTGLIDSADGSVQNSYDYDAFGKVIVLEENVTNPFTFSTKYEDIETGLFYYGYRYYSSVMGRWINRDPIEEQGGINIYGFVGNDGVNYWDYLGFYQEDGHFYTTYMVAIAGGKSKSTAFDLAYYSQYFDEVENHDAIHHGINTGIATGALAFSALRLANTSKDSSDYKAKFEKHQKLLKDVERVIKKAKEVQEEYHSLHGGNSNDITKRRNKLKKLIQQTGDPVKKGMLIHAFGDAYAHTYHGAQGLVAYSFPLGHAKHGTSPDIIANHVAKYLMYIRELYRSLGGSGGKITKIIETARKLPTNSKKAQEMMKCLAETEFGYDFKYDPRGGNYTVPGKIPSSVALQDVADMIKE